LNKFYGYPTRSKNASLGSSQHPGSDDMTTERSITPLLQKMRKSGYTLNLFANEINAHFSLSITRFDVSHFIHRQGKKIARNKRKYIRLFCIAHGWIAPQKPKQISRCKNCGITYPTGGRIRARVTVRKIKNILARGNNKRSTKSSQ
jgi:hypothetical protein